MWIVFEIFLQEQLEELNIYLDCLEENELNKFVCFDIIYEVTPAKI